MVAGSPYRGNLRQVPDVPRQWLMPTPTISLKDFKLLLHRRFRALARIQSTPSFPTLNPNPNPNLNHEPEKSLNQDEDQVVQSDRPAKVDDPKESDGGGLPVTPIDGLEVSVGVAPAVPEIDSNLGDQLWKSADNMMGIALNPSYEMDSPQAQVQGTSQINAYGEEQYWPISGKQRFNQIVTKSNVKSACELYVPAEIRELFPSSNIGVVFTFRGKEWVTSCKCTTLGRRPIKWKKFVRDNNLQERDGCIFELADISSSKITIRVQILRGDFPSQLMDKSNGLLAGNPIVID